MEKGSDEMIPPTTLLRGPANMTIHTPKHNVDHPARGARRATPAPALDKYVASGMPLLPERRRHVYVSRAKATSTARMAATVPAATPRDMTGRGKVKS